MLYIIFVAGTSARSGIFAVQSESLKQGEKAIFFAELLLDSTTSKDGMEVKCYKRLDAF